MVRKGNDNYLYRTFRLESVNTAQDLKRKANPLVSASVLLGGLVIAIIFVFMQKTISLADDLISTSSQDATAFLESFE